MTKLYLSVAALLSCTAAYAQSLDEQSHYFGGFFGKSAILLGSSDIRFGGGVSYGYGRREPRFKWGPFRGQFLLNGYADHTYPLVEREGRNPPNYSVGFLAGARWIAANKTANFAPYLDFGWGFQLADRTTLDLPSELNSTPWAGTGIIFPVGNYEALLGFRFVHISNAGFVRPNRGQDELFLTSEIRL